MTEQMAIRELEDYIELPFGVSISNETCKMAIQALKEIQQYRAIENELKEKYHANVDIKMLMKHFIETIFKGEKHEGFCILTNEDAKEWEELKAIGTVEELQALKEKSVAKKPYEGRFGVLRCPSCDEKVGQMVTKTIKEDCMNYCAYCGIKLDWE